MIERTRNWTAIFYPESANINECIEYLQEQQIPALISPEHNRDIEKNGNKKKEHYHVILQFDSVKTRAQVEEILNKCPAHEGKKAFTIPQIVQSISGATRYLIHLDNPEKAQYNAEDIIRICGANVEKYLENEGDKDKRDCSQIKRIMEIIKTKGVYEFEEVVCLLLEESPELFGCFRKNAYFFSQLLQSRQRRFMRLKEM